MSYTILVIVVKTKKRKGKVISSISKYNLYDTDNWPSKINIARRSSIKLIWTKTEIWTDVWYTFGGFRVWDLCYFRHKSALPVPGKILMHHGSLLILKPNQKINMITLALACVWLFSKALLLPLIHHFRWFDMLSIII